MKVALLAMGITLLQFSFSPSYASNTDVSAEFEDSAYLRVITERAGKIVTSLELPDSAAFLRVRTIVAGQYRALNAVYTERDDRLKQLKSQTASAANGPAENQATGKKVSDSLRKIVQQDVDIKIAKL